MGRRGIRRVAIASIAGVVSATGIGVGLVTSASGAATRSAAPPCTSASYTLAISATPTSGAAWSLNVTGQVDFVHDALSASVVLPANLPIAALDGATVQAVLVGGTVYVSVPPSLSGFVGGASWVSLALPSAMNSAVDGLLAEGAAWCANSQSLVTTLGRHTAVSSLGSSSFGSQPATGTEVHQPGSRVLKALHVPRNLVKPARSFFGKAPVKVDVWSGPHGQLVEADVTGPSISIDLQLTNVDQPVSISAPAGATPLPPSILSLLGGAL